MLTQIKSALIMKNGGIAVLNNNLCKCHHVPPHGSFYVGKKYRWTWGIDCIGFYDDDGKLVSFNEIEYLWYFSNIKDSQM